MGRPSPPASPVTSADVEPRPAGHAGALRASAGSGRPWPCRSARARSVRGVLLLAREAGAAGVHRRRRPSRCRASPRRPPSRWSWRSAARRRADRRAGGPRPDRPRPARPRHPAALRHRHDPAERAAASSSTRRPPSGCCGRWTTSTRPSRSSGRRSSGCAPREATGGAGLRARPCGPSGRRRPALGFAPSVRMEGLLDTDVPPETADHVVAVLSRGADQRRPARPGRPRRVVAGHATAGSSG